ncbi:MAG: EH signature domain-containing protein [Xenococcaceae cyanobacterium MO_167.B52]|nr:EH signature domain-containing protein [Xenococcaceae cyanobacterium MO_167.B52]
MNIQFRKIHLPPLPKVNANVLMQLAENNENSSLKPPSLPVGVPKSKIVSRSNLDEIIQDIENGRIKNITVLEWIYCLYNKDKWDAKNPDKSISTSEAIWKVAEQNLWLKQRLFWNLVLHLEFDNTVASSLASSYNIFFPQDSLDRGRLAIIKALKTKYPINDFIKLCWSELLTPSQLLIKYQLPTKISLTEASYDYVVPQFSTSDNINPQQIKWLLNSLKQMSREQQVKAVEYLLTQVNQHIGAEYPELINWLRQHYGSAVANSRWNELSSEAKAGMRKWLGAVSYQDFRKLVQFIIERLYLEEWEQRRLRNRSKFWSNYSDRFERIRILLPSSSVDVLGNHLNHQDVGILIDDGSDTTEVCIFDFGDWFVIEFFRGNGSESSMVKKEPVIEQLLFHSQLSVKRLRCLGSEIHDHEVCWQYSCEKWLRQKNIFPNEGIKCFQGLSFDIGKYHPEIGLPKPSAQILQKRKYKVERWKQDIIRLEREAQIYCIRNK